jgi:hypothetical protein
VQEDPRVRERVALALRAGQRKQAAAEAACPSRWSTRRA